LKKSTADKILKGNHLLGLDVIAYDNHYNRLDATKSSTIYLFEELIKNTNLIKNSNTIIQNYHDLNSLNDFSLNESSTNNMTVNSTSKFFHNTSNVSLNNHQTKSKSIQYSSSSSNSSRSIFTYAIKITLEIIKFPQNFDSDSTQLFVNLFSIKDNEANYLW
jgi:hypothetical protein